MESVTDLFSLKSEIWWKYIFAASVIFMYMWANRGGLRLWIYIFRIMGASLALRIKSFLGTYTPGVDIAIEMCRLLPY